jgi:hypothetical protein
MFGMRFPRMRPGQPIRTRFLNLLAEQAQRSSQLNVGGHGGLEASVGPQGLQIFARPVRQLAIARALDGIDAPADFGEEMPWGFVKVYHFESDTPIDQDPLYRLALDEVDNKIPVHNWVPDAAIEADAVFIIGQVDGLWVPVGGVGGGGSYSYVKTTTAVSARSGTTPGSGTAQVLRYDAGSNGLVPDPDEGPRAVKNAYARSCATGKIAQCVRWQRAWWIGPWEC